MATSDRPAKKFFIRTWGCQMNVHDSEKLASSLRQEGLVPAKGLRDADVVLLNTCAIREKAEEKVFSELGRLRALKERNPDAVIGVCGCVAQQVGSRIYERAPHVGFVLGPRASATLPEALRRIERQGGEARTTDLAYRDDSIRFPSEHILRDRTSPAKAYVTVVEGCNHSCTFCVVPRTRGREICRDMHDVLDEVRRLVGQGTSEIEFLGQTVNAYRDTAGHTLADLLDAAARIEGVRRIRFTTSHPAQMSERLMDVIGAAQPVVCPYLHLPVQSGSSVVLRAMKRGYDRAGYLKKIEGLRRRVPELSLGTDVIVGFPTETESDFDDTLSLLEEVRYDVVYSYTYSPRPETAAFAMADPVGSEEKLERLRRVNDCQRGIQEVRNRAWVGREVEVLVEGCSKRDAASWTGRTPENRVVNFHIDTAAGRFERIRITSSSPYALRGEAAGSA